MAAFSGKPDAITSTDLSTPRAFGAGMPLNAISNSQMKPPVEKTAFQAPDRATPWRAIFEFRICRSVFSLALPAVSWQLSASAQAAIITPDGSASSLTTASSSTPKAFACSRPVVGVDGIDRIASLSEEKQPQKQPSPDSNDSPTSPDSPADLDDSDGGLDDLSADTSTRNYQDTPLFSATDLDAVTLRAPGIIPVLLPAVCSFYCLHEHIRERAPPYLS